MKLLTEAVRVHAVDKAHRIFPRHVAVRVGLGARLVDGRELIVKHALHIRSHDVPLVKVGLFAVLTKHENAINSTWGQVLGKLLHKL